MKRPFLTLGTVQFGHPYGLRRNAPLLTSPEVVRLLGQAVLAGIRHFDTAHAYGLAERRLGEASDQGVITPDCRILTKTPVDLRADQVDECIEKAGQTLRRAPLDVLTLHRWEHRHSEAETLWHALLRARDEGRVKALGASVYTPAEACAAAQDPDITHLQIPCNVLDGRWENSELPSIKAARPDLLIYARSIYLQGILVSAPSQWPTVESVKPQAFLDRLDQMVAATGRVSRKELCFAYMQSLPWVDSLVVGIDNVEQLKENVHLAQQQPLTSSQCAEVRAGLPPAPEALLNPALWGKHA